MAMHTTLAATWAPHLMQPTATDWLELTIALTAALMCLWAYRVTKVGRKLSAEYAGPERRVRGRKRAYRASALFWGVCTGVFLLLALREVVDVQSWVINIAREFAQQQGWYGKHAVFLTKLGALIAGTGILVAGTMMLLTRELLPRHALAFFGIFVLGLALFLRVFPLSSVANAVSEPIAGSISVRLALDALGAGCVMLCAGMNCWWYRPGIMPDDVTWHQVALAR